MPDPRVVPLHLLRTDQEPGSDESDPAHLLARREIELGINLRGIPIPEGERIRLSITFDIDLEPSK